MATNNRPLKAYVRYDGSGRAVSSSLIWRKNKPKVGNWKEVQGYECCNNDVTNLFIQELQLPSAPLTALQFVVICNNYPSTGIQTRFLDVYVPYTGSSPTTPEELITLLNEQFSFLGIFTLLTPTTANLAINNSYLASGVCSNPQVEVGYSYA